MEYLLPGGAICHPKLVVARYSRNKAGRTSPPPASWQLGGTFGEIDDKRTPTEKDRDRILYTPLFHRLQGVTQVVSPQQDRHALHNRSSHSLKVASVAKALADKFTRSALSDTDLLEAIALAGGLDPAACEAAALAHDIGHPPFGHAAELTIDSWLRRSPVDAPRGSNPLPGNGFEGNAQSFRSVTVVEKKDEEAAGLELTNVTLAAILKYPWRRAFGNAKYQDKFGAYHTEGNLFESCRAWFTGSDVQGRHDVQTLEAAIMDIADDITYATHDLQDFVLSGVIVPAQVSGAVTARGEWIAQCIRAETAETEAPPAPSELSAFSDKVEKLRKNYNGFFDYTAYLRAIEYCLDHLHDLETGRSRPYPEAQLRELGAKLIEDATAHTTFERDSSVKPWPNAPRIHLDSEAWHRVQVLKDITKVFVIETYAIGVQQLAETESLLGLLDGLENWVARSSEKGQPGLPKALIDLRRGARPDVFTIDGFHEDPTKRAIADFCCSLTDAEAHRMSLHVRGLEVPRAVMGS